MPPLDNNPSSAMVSKPTSTQPFEGLSDLLFGVTHGETTIETLVTKLRRFAEKGLELTHVPNVSAKTIKKFAVLSSGDAVVVPEHARELDVQSALEQAKKSLSTLRPDQARLRVHKVNTGVVTRIRKEFKTHNMVKSGQNIDADSESIRKELALYLLAIEKAVATDLILDVGEEQTMLNYAVDSRMKTLRTIPVAEGRALARALHQRGRGHSHKNYKPDQKATCVLFRIDLEKPDNELIVPPSIESIRLSFTDQSKGVTAVVGRIHYSEGAQAFPIEAMGYTQAQQQLLYILRRRQGGAIFVSGVVCSGKTTSMYAYMRALMIEDPGRIVYTVEDPTEKKLEGAIQSDLPAAGTPVEKTEAATVALGSALRNNPTDIMLGEIRDGGGFAGIVCNAASTGINVLTTIHTKTAAGIPERLLGMEVPDYYVYDASTIAALICQALVRTLCDHCKLPVSEVMDPTKFSASDNEGKMNAAIYQSVVSRFLDDEIVDKDGNPTVFARNRKGCPHCENGRAGRKLIAEIILPDNKFMELYRSEGRAAAVKHWVETQNGFRMLDHAILRIQEGVLDPIDASLKELEAY